MPCAQAVADAFDDAWQQFARPARIVPESKPWWSEACQTAFDQLLGPLARKRIGVRFAVLSVKPSAISLPKGYKKSRLPICARGPDGMGQAAQEPPVRGNPEGW